MKLDTTTVFLGAVAVAAIYIATKPEKPLVPTSKDTLPPAAQNQPNWQAWLAIVPMLINSGLDAYKAIAAGIAAGKTPQQVAADAQASKDGKPGMTGYVGLHYGCSIAKVVA